LFAQSVFKRKPINKQTNQLLPILVIFPFSQSLPVVTTRRSSWRSGVTAACGRRVALACLCSALVATPQTFSGMFSGIFYGIGIAEAAGINFVVKNFVVQGDNPLSEERTNEVLSAFIGPHDSLERLQTAALSLEQTLRTDGYTFYRVTLPPQKLKEGQIRLDVKSFPIGKVTVEGNQHHSEENILRAIDELKVGHSPNVIALSKALTLANKNPSKKTDVTFAVNTGTGELEARVKVSDERPWGGFVWLDNTGSERTGDTRLGVGFQHNNMFDRDHILTATATTSPEEASSVRQLGINYRMPIYRTSGHLDLVAADSSVDSGTVAEAFEVKGEGRVVGLRYTQPLRRKGGYRHHIQGSLFDKRFENDISFDGTPIGSIVRSRPVGVEYQGNWSRDNVTTSMYVGHYRNLESGGNNDEESYSSVRSGATPDWSMNRYGASVGYTRNKWVAVGKIDAQSASQPLIPGEQFTAGGIRSVRGFQESELTDDKGYRAGFELWAPPMKYGIRLLGFADYGRVKRIDGLEGERVEDDISSVGFGVRWGWRNRMRAQFDYGYVIDGIDSADDSGTKDGDSKLHFSLFYRF